MLSLGASQNSGTPDQVRGDEWGLLGVQVRSDGRAGGPPCASSLPPNPTAPRRLCRQGCVSFPHQGGRIEGRWPGVLVGGVGVGFVTLVQLRL